MADNASNQESENMEVHHHSHSSHGKKNWKSYFWEFLMLFLAVFCGFLAEYQLEHIIEQNREKQFMQSLYTNLKKDTSEQRSFISRITFNYKQLDSIIHIINSRQYLTDPRKFYQLASRSRNALYFETESSTYDQIKNSGNIRLIRNKRLADSIVNYYSKIQDLIRAQEARYIQGTANIALAISDVLDVKYYNPDTLVEERTSQTQSITIAENVSMENVDEQKLLKYKNLCFEKMLLTRPFRNFAMIQTERASNLLSLLKEEYHFD